MAYIDHTMVNSDVSSLETLLETEKRRMEQELEELEAQIRDATERVSVIEIRLRHVNALLGESDAHSSTALETQPQKSDIADIAAAVLDERSGQPMYYKDLAIEVQARGGEIGGVKPWATLAARLVRDDRFVRPVRKGFYALRKDYPSAPNVGARKRQRQAA